jgi:hypothetical protein
MGNLGTTSEKPLPRLVEKPSEGQGWEQAEPLVVRFLRAFQVLLRSVRLYQKNHPKLLENLDAAARYLRAVLDNVGTLTLSLENGRITVASVSESPLADPRNELRGLADDLAHAGLSSLAFAPETNVGELDTLAQLVSGALLRSEASTNGGARTAQWAKRMIEHHIEGIQVNSHAQRRVDTVLTSLIAALVAYGGASKREAKEGANAPVSAPSFEELGPALRLLARLTLPLEAARGLSPQDAAKAIHATLAESSRETVRLLISAITQHSPRDAEMPQPYLLRLSEMLIFEFLGAEYISGRLAATDVRGCFKRLSDEIVGAGGYSGPHSSQHLSALATQWASETYRENLIERFWMELAPREKSAVLRSPQAWCVPVPALRQTLKQLVDAGADAPRREARHILLNYSRCLENQDIHARRSVAAGLSELTPYAESLWPHQLPEELSRAALRALEKETLPEIAALVAAFTESLARVAVTRGDFAGFESILTVLEQSPRDVEHDHLNALAQRLVAQDRWLLLVDAALANRPLEPVLPRLLERDPERLLDRLTLLLTEPRGQESLPAMARLLRVIGTPALSLLETRLFEARRQRVTAAIKLLSAAEPDRLLRTLPRSLASWDWSLQDLAVSELARAANGTPSASVAFAFAATLQDAHPLVAPMMIDTIGMSQEGTAIPMLMEIAAGEHEFLRDLYLRIKSVEALGRMRAGEAAELLRQLAERREGLTYAEPAGLRAAAEEALALIENRPSTALTRSAFEAAERSSGPYVIPRRYVRVPLGSPLNAQIEGPAVAVARVRTISLGGAYLESSRKLSVGDSIKLEIRTGLRRIHSTAVVRNLGPDGGGVEFVHMKDDDREKLRRFVRRHLRE